jgi:hypothetical protein
LIISFISVKEDFSSFIKFASRKILNIYIYIESSSRISLLVIYNTINHTDYIRSNYLYILITLICSANNRKPSRLPYNWNNVHNNDSFKLILHKV